MCLVFCLLLTLNFHSNSCQVSPTIHGFSSFLMSLQVTIFFSAYTQHDLRVCRVPQQEDIYLQNVSKDENNTTIFSGGVSQSITLETFESVFCQFNHILYASSCISLSTWANILLPIKVKVLSLRHCGFVEYKRRADARKAFDLQGWLVGSSHICIEWAWRCFKYTRWQDR